MNEYVHLISQIAAADAGSPEHFIASRIGLGHRLHTKLKKRNLASGIKWNDLTTEERFAYCDAASAMLQKLLKDLEYCQAEGSKVGSV